MYELKLVPFTPSPIHIARSRSFGSAEVRFAQDDRSYFYLRFKKETLDLLLLIPFLVIRANQVDPLSADETLGGWTMDRAELLEAALDCLPEGVALLGESCQVEFWNQAAHAITGYTGLDLVGRSAPAELAPLLESNCCPGGLEICAHPEAARAALVHLQHKLGHEVSTMARIRVLRDGMGARIGTAIVFHPAECLDALPQGEAGENDDVQASQDDLKDRLESLFEDFDRGGRAFGVLWIAVDQAQELHKTHGAGACEAMLQKVERALAHGLRPAEHLGRWGEDEFLVVSHERTPGLLADHAQTLAGLARTADFRWWGDRVSLTVSIGAAQTEMNSTLGDLLERAKAAMFSSYQAGGNHITAAPEGHSCLPS
jgi:diguanylate cyclase (GGDEF)-like protein/PAS domain S-box-containing protein